MEVSVEFLAKNRQFRLVHMNGGHYLLDVENSIWPIFIPFLFWFMPQKMYKVDKDTVEKLKISSEHSNKLGSILLLGIGVSAVLSQLLKPILDFTIETTMLVNILILIILAVVIIYFRLYMRHALQKRLYKTVDVEKLDTVKIKIRPKYIKQYFVPIIGFLFWSIFLVIMIPGFIETGHFVPLLAFLVFLPALLMMNTTAIHPNLGATNQYRANRVMNK